MPNVTFKVSGPSAYWARLDDEEIVFGVDNTKVVELDSKTVYDFTWWVFGNPGTTYQIEITPESGFKIRSNATIPVEKKIPQAGKTARAIKIVVWPN